MASSRLNPQSEKEIKELMKDFRLSDLPSKCTWSPDSDPEHCPHPSYRNRIPKSLLFSNILETIGNTPIVKLNKIPQSMGLECDVYVKCEFFNPGGSIKDRIAVRMIEDAENEGRLKPGDTIIESTGGNTGIGLAITAIVKGYQCIIICPEIVAKEKVDILKVLGADVILVPIDIHPNDPNGILGMAHVLNKRIPNSLILSQLTSPSNPMTHYDTTAEEILEALGSVDMFVCGSGTGGTLTGISRKLKQRCPNCVIVGADGEGSKMALPESMNVFNEPFVEVDGFNYNFVPTCIDRSIVDYWIKLRDVDTFSMTIRLIREEGILGGASSGFNVMAAMKAAMSLKRGQKCIVVLPDYTKNYVTTFVCKQWMEAKNLQPCVNKFNHSWWDIKISNLNFKVPITVNLKTSCGETIELMTRYNVEQVPILDQDGTLSAMITIQILTQKLMSRYVGKEDPIKKAGTTLYHKITEDTHLGLVSRIMEIVPYVVIVKSFFPKKLIGIITNLDFLRYIEGK